MSNVLEKIKLACDWVSAKSNGKAGPKVTTQVKWADWEKKYFSPVMCVLWYSEVVESGNINFSPPDSSCWIEKIANYLSVSNEWVENFIEQCFYYNKNKKNISVNINFEHIGSNSTDSIININTANPKVTWTVSDFTPSELTEEAQYCVEHYSHFIKENNVPYWTNNPPIDLYEKKLLVAVLDLYQALEAKKN